MKRTAFTLMELMVSIAILVVILLAVGTVFSGVSKTAGNSQAIMSMLADIRATEQVIARDMGGIDRSGFLVIRQRYQNPSTATAANGDTFAHLSPRYDQVAFISYGSFPDRTGSDSATPFTDGLVGNAAHVWIGQLVYERQSPPNASYNVAGQTGPHQELALPLNQPPTGDGFDEAEFGLGIHHSILSPGPGPITSALGVKIPSYQTLRYDASGTIVAASEGTAAHITSSRFSVVALSPAQLMAEITSAGTYPAAPDVMWDNLCYRFKALQSSYDTEITTNPFVNACFRQHPIAMQGVSSFSVEWNDGTMLSGVPVWYSYTNPNANASLNKIDNSGAALNGDNYLAVFTRENRALWPKALKFTFHVVDQNGRLSGGRDFTQVVQLP